MKEFTKTCFRCEEEKPLSEFYKHSKMSDGYLSKCKSCTKEDVKNRYLERKELELDFLLSERERGRRKYHRLGYVAKKIPRREKKKINARWSEKHPEKKKASNVRRYYKVRMKIPKKIELHHWSYNEDDIRDVMFLTHDQHTLAHRYLEYDQTKKMYRTLDGKLLKTNLEHYNYISQFFHLKVA